MTTRLLETGFETKFHALQIIFVRMLATALIGSIYMWYQKVPGFPFGSREIRGLLILRGTAGTAGLIGLYCTVTDHFEKKHLLTYAHRFAIVPRYLRCNCHYISSPHIDGIYILGGSSRTLN